MTADLYTQYQAWLHKLVLRYWRTVPFLRRLGSLTDANQEGQIALLHAARRYDPDHPAHAHFTTYARPIILEKLLRAAAAAALVRIPVHHISAAAFGRPSDRPSAGQAQQFAQANHRPLTTAPLTAHEPDRHHHDALYAALSRLPARDRRLLAINFGLPTAEQQEQEIEPDSQTLAQVGARMGLSAERIRQLKARAMTRLRRELAGAA